MADRIARSFLPALMTGVLFAFASPAHAAWPEPIGQNLLLSDTLGLADAVAASDGKGGFFLAYQTTEAGAKEIRLRRYDATGASVWATLDLVLSRAVTTNSWLLNQVLPDDRGGAFVSWREAGSTFVVRVQHAESSGVVAWPAPGLEVRRGPAAVTLGGMAHDGQGGVVITWGDLRYGYGNVPYAQYVGADGITRWDANGIGLSSWGNEQTDVQIVRLESGGWFAGWARDYLGTWVWDHCLLPPSGVVGPVQTGAASANNFVLPAGGNAVWRVYRVDTAPSRLYVERLSGGTLQFRRTISDVGSVAQDPHAVVDGAGGLFVTWYDTRATGTFVRAQHLLPGDGSAEWTANGIALNGVPIASAPSRLRLAAGAAGQLFVAWTLPSDPSSDPWAAIVRANGTLPYAPVRMSSAANDQLPIAAVPLGDGASWGLLFMDARDGLCSACPPLRVRGQNLDQWGERGQPEPEITSVRDVHGDEGGFVRVAWNASPLEQRLPSRVGSYRVWRSLPVTAALRSTHALARTAEDAVRTGMPWIGPAASNTFAWEYLATVPAARLPAYGYTAATPEVSTKSRVRRTTFLVEALAPDGGQWFSAPDSGYSVDDLAPPAPAAAHIQWNGQSTRLGWLPALAPDLAGYRVHAGTSEDFTPDPENLVATITDTSCVHATTQRLHYKLVAFDTHENDSPVVLLVAAEVLDVPALPARLSFATPAPNPSRGAVTLRFALPRESHATLRVFDAAGRVVRTLADGALAAGDHVRAWDGRDAAGRALPPGLYLARLECAGERAAVQRIARVE